MVGSLAGLCGALLLGACVGSSSKTAQTTPQQPPPYYGPPGYPQQPYPNGPAGPMYPPPAQQPQQPQQPQPPAARPLLAPLIGTPAMQQELRGVLSELINALPAQKQALVRGIPLVFDPTPEVNAYAGCDEQGAPFLAATAGIFDAVDAIAQTKATDELFGTRTYEAYTSAVLPEMSRNPSARAGLPAGIIPTNLGPDLRRWSRAHELFDEILAFTFGHELAHHYLGHTGCAKGQSPSAGPDPARLGRLLTNIPVFNQFAESAADTEGAMNALDAGRARRPQYSWSEGGGVYLLTYFADIERLGGGGGPLSLLSPVQFLRTHPNPLARVPLVQTVARTWHLQHPG
ncbi:hypothetical protein AKJ09_09241 [Labilithrix luteola]|uniref:Peptidase M48 domain-containing protein n=1 Tax=Labilithrix luteola TaxID=1391654 RepID=A0A0K1QA12_9BACT|nr:hypothetical protein AKJ09_09241 [Labilithrix luteola]